MRTTQFAQRRLEALQSLPYTAGAPLRKAEDSILRKSHVLVVDDEELYRRALERILVRAGYEVVLAGDGTEALEIVNSTNLDLVLCDVKMPGISGLEVVSQISETTPDLPCIVITGYGGAESSVESLKAGAFWYLEKPFEQEHLDVVRRLVGQAIEHGRLRRENRFLQHELRSRHKFDSIIGRSQPLRAVLELVEKVADTDSTVLITGESGTGKELVARALHYNSRRAERMLVAVNCGAIPEELLESELFGHVRGAFTNAIRDREGRFTAAHGGTIFLDEIGDMSPNLQVKLLRVLQSRSFEPVGSSETVEIDVRVIAATNQNLEQQIADGKFREDLYYRLNVLPIEVPALRDRREDIPLLVQHFFEIANQEKGTQIESISEDAMGCMTNYEWPGNVRELRNIVERVAILAVADAVEVDDLPAKIQGSAPSAETQAPRVPETGISFNGVVEEIERDMIRQALEHTGWNKNKAAQLLGLNRTTLLEKIRKRGVQPTTTDS